MGPLWRSYEHSKVTSKRPRYSCMSRIEVVKCTMLNLVYCGTSVLNVVFVPKIQIFCQQKYGKKCQKLAQCRACMLWDSTFHTLVISHPAAIRAQQTCLASAGCGRVRCLRRQTKAGGGEGKTSMAAFIAKCKSNTLHTD